MARWRAIDTLLDSWVVLMLNLPALVIAVLLYVWLGLTEVAAISAVTLSKLPTVIVTLREGARTLDRAARGLKVVPKQKAPEFSQLKKPVPPKTSKRRTFASKSTPRRRSN